MNSKMDKILIIGATSGIGEALARQFHARGKQLIITGRRQERLSSLEQELSGVKTIRWDISDTSSIASHCSTILQQHPDLDTVIIPAGVSALENYLDPSSTSDEQVLKIITTNLTAPMLISRALLPHLVKIAESGRPANLLHTSSGLAFTPTGMAPTYCTTKGAIHTFCLTLRDEVNNSKSDAVRKNLSICEIVPPYVATDFDVNFRDTMRAVTKPMPLDEYIDETMKGLDELEDDGGESKLKKEVGAGSSIARVAAWRNGMSETFAKMGRHY